MLSYQHIYHAGNIADIHKHSILVEILHHQILKPRPMTYIETHAGRGLYDLRSKEAKKTNEAEFGIKRITKKNFNCKYTSHIPNSDKCDFYSGSPIIAKKILRPSDTICLAELHPHEFKLLKSNIQGKNIRLFNDDGYEVLKRITPPKHRSGVVFIDPSYEIKSEYEDVISAILDVHQFWPGAIIILWYPILKAGLHEAMRDYLSQQNFKNYLNQELIFAKENPFAMLGSGLLIINTPFNLMPALGNIYQDLQKIF